MFTAFKMVASRDSQLNDQARKRYKIKPTVMSFSGAVSLCLGRSQLLISQLSFALEIFVTQTSHAYSYLQKHSRCLASASTSL